MKPALCFDCEIQVGGANCSTYQGSKANVNKRCGKCYLRWKREQREKLGLG